MASAAHTEPASALTPGTPVSEVEALVRDCLAWAVEQPPSSGLKLVARWRALLEVAESDLINQQGDAGTPAHRDRLANAQNISKAEARRKAERAEAIRQNPELGDKLQNGLITAEHVDVLADAERKTPGASKDRNLFAEVCGSNPDQAKKKADQYRADKMKADQAEARYKRQRGLRGVRKHTTKEGMPALTMQGDDASINEIWQQLTSTANGMYQADGGREVTEHERSHQQRLFDAAMAHFTGQAAEGASSRPTVVITVPADKLDGTDPDAVAQVIGTGPIPDSLLARYLCKSDLVAMVLGASGENLWQGRSVRYATRPQVLALIQRDRSCVLCGAPHWMCEAHHLLPWNATGLGETELENLALVCSACHRRIHDNDLTLFREPVTQRWETRPATVHEQTRDHRRKPRRAA